MKRIKQNKDMVMYYFKVEDLLCDYKNMEMFHVRGKIKRQHIKYEEMLKGFIYNLEDLKKERKKLRNLMYIIGKEYLMECQKCGYIFCIEFGITSERRPEILNGKSKHPYMKRSHCEEQLNILLCKRNTNIIKEYIDILMTVFKNEKTFAIQSRPSIRKVF